MVVRWQNLSNKMSAFQNAFTAILSIWSHVWLMTTEKQNVEEGLKTFTHIARWKLTPKLKPSHTELYNPPKSCGSAQLDVFRTDDCFQLFSLTGEKEAKQKPLHIFLTKIHPEWKKKKKALLQTHRWYGREQNRPLFPREGVHGGGEECHHLWGDIFCFIAAFSGMPVSPVVRAQRDETPVPVSLWTSVHVGRSYQTRHSC